MRRIDDHPAGRHYDTPAGALPSVSTILGATKDMSQIDAWRERVGSAFADAVRDAAAKRGTAVHAEIEDAMFFGWPTRASAWLESLRPEVEAAMVASERRAEAPVFSRKHGFAGTPDLVGEVDGRTILWDWKTYLPSGKVARAKPPKKKREHLEDYLLQARAYAKAVGSTFRIEVDEIRVAIARCAVRSDRLHPLPCQVVRVRREDPEYSRLWSAFQLRLGLWIVKRSAEGAA